MLVPWNYLDGRNLATDQCARGAERKRRSLTEEELRESSEGAFQAYGAPLENVMGVRLYGEDDYGGR